MSSVFLNLRKRIILPCWLSWEGPPRRVAW
ncbi:hypothetical protein [Vibrio hangzhouensis]